MQIFERPYACNASNFLQADKQAHQFYEKKVKLLHI